MLLIQLANFALVFINIEFWNKSKDLKWVLKTDIFFPSRLKIGLEFEIFISVSFGLYNVSSFNFEQLILKVISKAHEELNQCL